MFFTYDQGLRERLADQLIGQVEVNLQGGKGFRARSLGRCSVACRQVRPELGDLGGDQLLRPIARRSSVPSSIATPHRSNAARPNVSSPSRAA